MTIAEIAKELHRLADAVAEQRQLFDDRYSALYERLEEAETNLATERGKRTKETEQSAL